MLNITTYLFLEIFLRLADPTDFRCSINYRRDRIVIEVYWHALLYVKWDLRLIFNNLNNTYCYTANKMTHWVKRTHFKKPFDTYYLTVHIVYIIILHMRSGKRSVIFGNTNARLISNTYTDKICKVNNISWLTDEARTARHWYIRSYTNSESRR